MPPGPRPRRAAVRHGTERRTPLHRTRSAVRAGDRGGRRRRTNDRAVRATRAVPLVHGRHTGRTGRHTGGSPARRAPRRPAAAGDRAVARGLPGDMVAWTSRRACSSAAREAEAAIDPPLPFYQSPRASLAAQLVYCGEPGSRAGDPPGQPARASGEGAEHTRGFVYFFMPDRGVAPRALGRRSALRPRPSGSTRRRPTIPTTAPSAGYAERPRGGRPRGPRRGTRLRGGRAAAMRLSVGDEPIHDRQRGPPWPHRPRGGERRGRRSGGCAHSRTAC